MERTYKGGGRPKRRWLDRVSGDGDGADKEIP